MGALLVFIPHRELTARSLEWIEGLELRFSGARPQAEKYAWTTVASSLLSGALLLGLLAFLYRHFKGQSKPLKFMEPSQMFGSIDDLVGMDDIKAEVAQIKDQYQRRAEYSEYGIAKPFNVMYSGPAGTGKTRLASYLAKELRLPILFNSWPGAKWFHQYDRPKHGTACGCGFDPGAPRTPAKVRRV